ncbi:hypothetical protein [Methanofollis fontis]|nr:hypothetical protein [Methanofollis fontis]
MLHPAAHPRRRSVLARSCSRRTDRRAVLVHSLPLASRKPPSLQSTYRS